MTQRESRSGVRGTKQTNPMLARLCTILWWMWIGMLALVASSRFFAALAWPIDLLANVSYFVVLPAAITLLLALWRGRMIGGAVMLVVVLVGAWPVRFMLWPRGAASAASVASPRWELRVLEVNVKGSKEALDGLARIINRTQPDVVIVIEIPAFLEKHLLGAPGVKEQLHFVIAPDIGSPWRDMMMSRFPLHQLHFDGDASQYQGVFAFQRSCFVDAPGGRFLLSAMHPPSPREAQSWARGNEWTSRLAEVCRRFLLKPGVPVVIAGDFNTTPAGHRHRLMRSHSGLRPVDELGGWSGTWPSNWPGPLRLPIDRVWVSPDVQFISREVLEDIGSDHRPILVTLSLPGAAPAGEEPSDGR